MTSNDFYNNIKETADNGTLQPSTIAWDRIKLKIHSAKAKRKNKIKNILLSISSIAAICLLLILIDFSDSHHQKLEAPNVAYNQYFIQDLNNTGSASTQINKIHKLNRSYLKIPDYIPKDLKSIKVSSN